MIRFGAPPLGKPMQDFLADRELAYISIAAAQANGRTIRTVSHTI